MKNVILIIGVLISLLAAHTLFAQQEGIVYYEMKVNMHRNLPPDRAEMKEMIPEFNVHQYKLAFKGEESYYKNVDEEEEEEFSDAGGNMRVRMRIPMNEYYVNRKSAKSITLQEFFGKKFLIEDSIKILPWKLTGETKKVLDYDCRKATYYIEDRKQTIVAWYAEKLPLYFGPEAYNSLPGAILQLDVNDGERVITAKNISFQSLAKGDLVIPSKGQKTTEADFRKMVEEQRRRMGGGGNVIIRN